MADLDKKLYDLCMEVRRAELGMSHGFSRTAHLFEKAVAADLHTPMLRALFIEQHDSTLRQIKRFMLEHAKTDTMMRSLHDRIFHEQLKLGKFIPLPITKYFDAFVKGITYFAAQDAQNGNDGRSPIYHRLTSCGNGTLDFRTRYNQCRSGMTRKERNAVKRQIERCYIERLIYDAIYTQQTLHFPERGNAEPSQDAGHRNWLQQTHADFKTCFPKVDVRVTVDAFDGLMPMQVTIERIRQRATGSAATIKETYTRSLLDTRSVDPWGGLTKEYHPAVECVLYTAEGGQKGKVQGFFREEKWSLQHRQ
jgi:hypothetical protein